MNREPESDPLDEVLRSRRAIPPPSRFTDKVLARVKAEPRLTAIEEVVAGYGLQAGIAAAAFGVCLAVDINGAAAKMTDALLQAPSAADVAAIVAICLTWALMRQEPDGDAL